MADSEVRLSPEAFSLSTTEARIVAGFLLQHMGQDLRGKLASNFPHLYNKLCGRNIMDVAWTTDGSRAYPDGSRGPDILRTSECSRPDLRPGAPVE